MKIQQQRQNFTYSNGLSDLQSKHAFWMENTTLEMKTLRTFCVCVRFNSARATFLSLD